MRAVELLGIAGAFYLLSLCVGVWVGMAVGAASLWRAFPLERMERQRPGFIQLSEAGLAWRSMEDQIERFVPWTEISGAISRVVRWWRGEPIGVFSSLRLYLRDRSVFEINGYTTDFAYVVSEIKRCVAPSARWVNRDVVYLTSLRSPLGCWPASILMIGAYAFCGASLLWAGAGDLWPRDTWATGLATILAAWATSVSWMGMPYIEDAAAANPKRPLAWGMLLLGGMLIGSAFLSFLTGYLGLIANLILVLNGIYWIGWAAWRLLRPIYLVPK
jgi:hypothetical protein